MRTTLTEKVHQQPSTSVATDNTAADRIFNRTAKNIYRAIDMIFYWVRDRKGQSHLHIFWEEGNKYPVDYVTKQHPI